jgi:hypothetical protein
MVGKSAEASFSVKQKEGSENAINIIETFIPQKGSSKV